MARLLRLNPKEGIHHVTNHAVGAEDLFKDDPDRRTLLKFIEDARKLFGVVVLNYCLMGNHFHLVVRCPEGNLDRFMAHFESRYARYFNTRHGRRGALFLDRYHNELVTTDGQLQFTLRYVERNPLELGIDINSYPWGSYGFYSGFRSGRDEILTIDPRSALAAVGSIHQYRRFVEDDVAHDKFRRNQGTRRIIAARERPTADSLQLLIRTIAQISGQPESIVTASKRGRTNDARLLAFLISAASEIPPETAMAQLGCSARSTYWSTVNRARRRVLESSHFASLAEAVESEWSAQLRPAA